MKPEEILPGVYWVGALHPDLRVFDDLFPTASGTSYNSYLLGGESPTIIDTVKAPFADVFFGHLRQHIDPAEVKYVVCNHAEPDHSGTLARVLEQAPNATVLGTKAVGMFLKELLNRDFPFRAISDGDELDLGGGRKLAFVTAPFLHWPDTMFTYLPEHEAAFTCDAFGAHFCPHGGLWAEDNPDYVDDQKVYYDCLVRIYSANVRDAFEKVKDVPIKYVLPSHGPLLRAENMKKTLERYVAWSALPEKGEAPVIGIVYLSAHGNTLKMAEAVAEGVRSAGGEPDLARWSEKSEDEIAALYQRADALAIGTPTINRDVPFPMWKTLSLMSLSALPRKKIGGYFGSYGWSGEAAKLVEARLAGIGYKLPAESVRCRFSPTDEDLVRCRELGKALVEAAKA